MSIIKHTAFELYKSVKMPVQCGAYILLTVVYFYMVVKLYKIQHIYMFGPTTFYNPALNELMLKLDVLLFLD